MGNVTRYVYDKNDRLIERIDPLGNSETFGYDTVGNRILHIDRNGRKRTFDINEINQVVEERWHDDSDLVFFSYSYTYDLTGRVELISSVDNTLRYEYDLAGNERVVESRLASDNIVLTYEYDKNGFETNVIDNEGWEISSRYDQLSLLKERSCLLYTSDAADE